MTQHDLAEHDVRKINDTGEQKAYSRPRIVQELALETRAGSPLGIPNPLDPAGIDPAE